MQNLEESVFSVLRTTNLSPAVFHFLQPSVNANESQPLGGILRDTRHGWLALGSKLCVIDLKSGLKIAAWTFGSQSSTNHLRVTSVVELKTPLTETSHQLVISLECEDGTGLICVFHVNGSQILSCIQTEAVISEMDVCDEIPDGPFTCFDSILVAGTKSGEIIALDLNRAGLIQALKDISQGNDHLVPSELNSANLAFLPLDSISQIAEQRDLAIDNNDHLAILLNENSIVDGQYLFHNPDRSIRMKAKQDHVRVSTLQYIPQLGSVAVGFNFGAFQIWNLVSLELEFTSQVNVECLPVTHFGFQEPCDDPRAFCYLWVVYSALDCCEDEEFPLAVMYSFTYHGKRMLSDTKYLYQDFLTSNIRFQVELSSTNPTSRLVGGRCVSCHTYSINSALGDDGDENMLNLCHFIWECWNKNDTASSEYGMLLFDLDQWYKDQMPARYDLQNTAFMSSTRLVRRAGDACRLLHARLGNNVAVYRHATSLDEHFYPESLQYECICLGTSDITVIGTRGIQRQIISALSEAGERLWLEPGPYYAACVKAGVAPLPPPPTATTVEAQRGYLLSVCVEGGLGAALRRSAHAWAAGAHAHIPLTLTFMVDWCWQRAIELKEYAKDLTAPLFTSSALPDRNIIRSLSHCVKQLTQLTSLLDSILTKCCNLVVPESLSDIEEKHKGVGTVALYFAAIQWFVSVGLLPERHECSMDLPYPAEALDQFYKERRIKLRRLQDGSNSDETAAQESCSLLYIDQLIENEMGGDRIHEIWRKGGSAHGLYPPPTLHSLLRVYLLPEIADELKHSLILYLLVDYAMYYSDIRYEGVVRRLMQFPTMFGMNNTAIKATQAFWHLDHRDFDFALDQLQCLTGNTLSEWQHQVVLSSLLAQKKTQQALQYLNVRKPPPIENSRTKFIGHLDDWQSSCDLYIARGLVHEALDVVRLCVGSTTDYEEKVKVLEYFFKVCRKTGQLAKILDASLLPLEEEVFIRYIEDCNEKQTSIILVMYYLQQSRYLEAQQLNNKLRARPSAFNMTTSVESLLDFGTDRDTARDSLVDMFCSSLPDITERVARYAINELEDVPHMVKPKPMSVFVQGRSPKDTFTYKSTFIQDTIENASETWLNKPTLRRGLKRALNIEETPFLCTPKLDRSRSILAETLEGQSSAKRLRLDQTPKTPKRQLEQRWNMSQDLQTMLDMGEALSPQWKLQRDRTATPQSILKVRRSDIDSRSMTLPESRSLTASPDVGNRSDDEDSCHTHNTDKQLRFTIPTASESGSTPSPIDDIQLKFPKIKREREESLERDNSMDLLVPGHSTTETHGMEDKNPMESPSKKLAVEEKMQGRKSYKDNVRARRSLSVSNSSLTDDPNTSIESIADIPITLINPRYTGEKRRQRDETEIPDTTQSEKTLHLDKTQERDSRSITPKGRRAIREVSTPRQKSLSATSERLDSPTVTPISARRLNRSRSKTPESSKSPLESIMEQPQEIETEPSPSNRYIPRSRSRSRTPERMEKLVRHSPRLDAIHESPNKDEQQTNKPEDGPNSPGVRTRSRSRTPEVESSPATPASPRRQRGRSMTPDREKVMSPKEKPSRAKKSLTRMVLEKNAFADTKSTEKCEEEVNAGNETSKDHEPRSILESTPKQSTKNIELMDVTFSPISNKSILQSPEDSVVVSDTSDKEARVFGLFRTDKSFPGLKSFSETLFEKSVLKSYQSTVGENSTQSIKEERSISVRMNTIGDVSSINCKSVLRDGSSLMTSDSDMETNEDVKAVEKIATDENVQKEKRKIVEIEREINEIEGDISEESEEDNRSNDDIDMESEHSESGEEAGDEESEGDEDHEVISIADTSEESSAESSSDKLEIEEKSQEAVAKEKGQDLESETIKEPKAQAAVVDPLSTNVPETKEISASDRNVTSEMPGIISILTDDNSITGSDQSELNLNYSDENKLDAESKLAEAQNAEDKTAEMERQSQTEFVKEPNAVALENKKVQEKATAEAATVPEVNIQVTVTSIDLDKDIIERAPKDFVQTDIDVVDAIASTPTEPVPTKTDEFKDRENKEKLEETPAPRTRKRATSTDSNTSIIELGTIDESQQLVTKSSRKRTKSNTSLTGIPELPETPTRSRSKTPTAAVSRILTRRASKELSESKILEESTEADESIAKTPNKRTTRSRSKNIDDNASDTSEISVQSKASEEEGRVVRKGRKSILATKPDLSVIPEISTEEGLTSRLEDNSDIMNEYSSARRLTRNQKSMLESWLEPRKSPGRSRKSSRNNSVSDSIDEEPTSSRAFDVPSIDRMSLLNKKEFEGEEDAEERCETPETVNSDALRQRRARMGRAASETKVLRTVKVPQRRGSVDIANTSASVDSPSGTPRSRRACFTKALEALHHTPKSRRLSTDSRASVERAESEAGSPAPSETSVRSRRNVKKSVSEEMEK